MKLLRNHKYLFYSSTEILDILLAAILFSLGLILAIHSKTFDNETGHDFLKVFASVDKWGYFFSFVGLSQIARVLWPRKPKRWLTDSIRCLLNFSFVFIAISLYLKYPSSPHCFTYGILAIASFFSAMRYDKRVSSNV